MIERAGAHPHRDLPRTRHRIRPLPPLQRLGPAMPRSHESPSWAKSISGRGANVAARRRLPACRLRLLSPRLLGLGPGSRSRRRSASRTPMSPGSGRWICRCCSICRGTSRRCGIRRGRSIGRLRCRCGSSSWRGVRAHAVPGGGDGRLRAVAGGLGGRRAGQLLWRAGRSRDRCAGVAGVGRRGMVGRVRGWLGGEIPVSVGLPLLATREEAGALGVADILAQIAGARLLARRALLGDRDWIAPVIGHLVARLAWDRFEPGRMREIAAQVDAMAAQDRDSGRPRPGGLERESAAARARLVRGPLHARCRPHRDGPRGAGRRARS